MEIAWSNTPPQKTGTRILVLRPGQQAIATILGEHVGVEIHWVGKRSRPCQGAGICPMCKEENPRQWRAYLPTLVQLFVQRGMNGSEPIGDWSPKVDQAVLELTESHGELLSGGNLRGMRVELYKPRGEVRQPLRVNVAGKVDGDLDPPFDVKRILLRIWGITREELSGPRIMKEQA